MNEEHPLPPPDVVYVSFSAEITVGTAESLIATMAQLANDRIPEVHLLMSTPGGNVMSGINIYNVLRAMPFELVTHNVGNVDSIGNAIFLAGDRRYACPHSTFMFHGVGFDGGPGERYDEKLLRERLEGVLADQTRIGSILAERTSLAADQIEPLFRDAQTKDATYAVGTGIVDEVRDVSIPPDAPVLALVFNR